MTTLITRKNRTGKKLAALVVNKYFTEVPLDKIFEIIKSTMSDETGEIYAIDESGEAWEGFLCGTDGRASIALKNCKLYLFIGWYKMPSGRFEVNAYIS